MRAMPQQLVECKSNITPDAGHHVVNELIMARPGSPAVERGHVPPPAEAHNAFHPQD